LEIVQGETYNLQSSFKALEAEFNNLVAKYQKTKAILQKRQQQLEQAIAENKAIESKIQSTDYLQNKTMESVNRQQSQLPFDARTFRFTV
jgi:ribosomal protein S1